MDVGIGCGAPDPRHFGIEPDRSGRTRWMPEHMQELQPAL